MKPQMNRPLVVSLSSVECALDLNAPLILMCPQIYHVYNTKFKTRSFYSRKYGIVIWLGECGQLGVVANQRVLWPTRECCGQHSLPNLWAMVPAPWHANHMATELGECGTGGLGKH